MQNLLHRLSHYQPFTVMVVGDFMLDQHVYGAAERLSPDAPVPVLHAMRHEDQPGGAANVARCLHALKARVLCVGVTGNDVEGALLRDALREQGCDVAGLVADTARPTTIKRSMIGLAQHRHPQKMFRVDMESHEPIADAIRAELMEYIRSHIDRVDVLCLEDYNKGVCSEALCRRDRSLPRPRGAGARRSGRHRGLPQVPRGHRRHAQPQRGRTGHRAGHAAAVHAAAQRTTVRAVAV
jgi:D-beta-D-heptose 7-phosphate kinase/D-beta-D-heptose 1-phosphate adenosyltransferase